MSDRMERSRTATIHFSSNYHLAHESFVEKILRPSACKQFNVESILETMNTMLVYLNIACQFTKSELHYFFVRIFRLFGKLADYEFSNTN